MFEKGKKDGVEYVKITVYPEDGEVYVVHFLVDKNLNKVFILEDTLIDQVPGRDWCSLEGVWPSNFNQYLDGMYGIPSVDFTGEFTDEYML